MSKFSLSSGALFFENLEPRQLLSGTAASGVLGEYHGR